MTRGRRLLACAGVLASGWAAGAELPADRTLTLEDSVRLALNNSQTILTVREDVNIALQRVRESESLFFPKLDLNANWSKFRVEDNTPLLIQPALGPTLIPSSPRENFYTARANIYQTVYEGGRVRNTWRQARISYERARAADDSLRVVVTADAKQAFYDLLLAQERQREYAAVMSKLRATGVTGGTVMDRLRGQAGLDALGAEASDATLAQQQARLEYLRALNIELNTNVELKGELETRPVEIDLQKMLAWSSQYRSELRQTEYQQELDALGISLSLAERTPTVAFGASYERNGHDINLDTANWAGTLNVNLPVSISDMFYGWAKVREHRAQFRQAELKSFETATQIELQVRKAYERYRYWQTELVTRREALRRLDTLLDELRGRPSVPFQDRAEAERLRLGARLRYDDAIHGHLTALAALEKAVGHPLEMVQ